MEGTKYRDVKYLELGANGWSISTVKESIKTKSEVKGYNQKQLDRELLSQCTIGDLELVKYLMTSPELKFHANLKSTNYMPFHTACGLGHLDIVKFMLNELDPEQKPPIWQEEQNSEGYKYVEPYGFTQACKQYSFEVVEYLFTLQEFTNGLANGVCMDTFEVILESSTSDLNSFDNFNILPKDPDFSEEVHTRNKIKTAQPLFDHLKKQKSFKGDILDDLISRAYEKDNMLIIDFIVNELNLDEIGHYLTIKNNAENNLQDFQKRIIKKIEVDREQMVPSADLTSKQNKKLVL